MGGRALLLLLLSVVAGACATEPRGCPYAEAGGLRSTVIERGHARIHVETEGRGPPLVLVHGAADHGIFHPALGALREDRTLVYVDQRGFGRTRVSPGGPATTLGTDVEDLEAVRTGLGLERMDLLALSNGGPIAIEYALAHPARVRRLVLLSTYADNDARVMLAIPLVKEVLDDPRHAEGLARIRAREDWSSERKEIEELLLLPHPHHHGRLPRAVAAAWIRQGVLGPAADEEQARWRSPPSRSYHGLPALSRLAMPTLVVVGRHDRITPLAHAREMASRLSRGRLVVLEDAGHLAFVEAPDAFLVALRAFLDVSDSRSSTAGDT